MRPRTLAGRFLSIVVLGALLPLALVGLWLTRSAERSGIELLRGQLDHAADAIAATIEQRWTLREGELRLLASNTAAISVLRGDALAADERAYLQQTAMSLASSIPVFEYRDLGGGTRWRFERPRSTDSRSEVIVAQASVRAFDVELPVESDGKTIGTLRARVSVSSVLAPVIGQALIPGASLAIADTSGAALVNNGDSAGAPSPAVAPASRCTSRWPTAAPSGWMRRRSRVTARRSTSTSP